MARVEGELGAVLDGAANMIARWGRGELAMGNPQPIRLAIECLDQACPAGQVTGDEQRVAVFLAWLFRGGGLPPALFASSIIRNELDLLEAVIDGDEVALKELNRRIRVDREDVFMP